MECMYIYYVYKVLLSTKVLSCNEVDNGRRVVGNERNQVSVCIK